MQTKHGHFATNKETGELILGPVPANSLQTLQEDICELFNMTPPEPDELEIRRNPGEGQPIPVPVPVPMPAKA